MRHGVVVAVDGSDKDGRALAVGRAVAALSDAEIHIVRVVPDHPPNPTAGSASRALDAIEASDARRQLEGMIATLRSTAGVEATPFILQAQDVPAALIQHAVDHSSLMIVMATRAAGAAGRAVVGSVADRVMRESPLPVMLVPPGAAFLAEKEPRLRRVLVPLQDSSLSFRAIEFLMTLPHAATLEYALVEVVPDERSRPTAERRLKGNEAWLRSHGVKTVEAAAIESPDPAEAIVGVVRDVMPELIAMSTRGSSGLSRLVFGSVAEGVVRRSELPVLLLTPKVLAG